MNNHTSPSSDDGSSSATHDQLDNTTDSAGSSDFTDGNTSSDTTDHIRVPQALDLAEQIDREINEVVHKHIRGRIVDLERKLRRQEKTRKRLESKLEWVQFEIRALSLIRRLQGQHGGGRNVMTLICQSGELHERRELEPVLRVELERSKDAERKMRDELDELRSRQGSYYRDGQGTLDDPLPSGVEYFTVII
jgi:hypothetical protein